MIHAHTQAHGIYIYIYLPRIWNKKPSKRSISETSAHCLYKGAVSSFHGHGDDITKTHGVITCGSCPFQKFHHGSQLLFKSTFWVWTLDYQTLDFLGCISLIMIYNRVTTSESLVFTNMATQKPNRTLTTLKIIAGGPKASSVKDLQINKFYRGEDRGGGFAVLLPPSHFSANNNRCIETSIRTPRSLENERKWTANKLSSQISWMYE